MPVPSVPTDVETVDLEPMLGVLSAVWAGCIEWVTNPDRAARPSQQRGAAVNGAVAGGDVLGEMHEPPVMRLA